jgi:hypothetical protein
LVNGIGLHLTSVRARSWTVEPVPAAQVWVAAATSAWASASRVPAWPIQSRMLAVAGTGIGAAGCPLPTVERRASQLAHGGTAPRRTTAATWQASGFRRFAGVVHLVVVLPDGSLGTIRADATDVLAAAAPGSAAVVLDAGGVRALRCLVAAMGGSLPSRRRNGK